MEAVRCNLCQAQDTIEVASVYDWYWFNGGPFTVVRCRQCGLTYLNPRPTKQEVDPSMWDMWSVSTQNMAYIGSEDYARKIYPEIIAHLNKTFQNRGRLLEIGCGQGSLLKVCQQDGWEVYGVDISEGCVNYARNVNGLDNVFVGESV